MDHLNKRVRIIYFLIDIVIIFILFFVLVFKFNPALTYTDIIITRLHLLVCFFWGIILILLLHSAHLYYTNRSISISREWQDVAKCVLTASILTALFIYFLRINIFPRLIFIKLTFSLLFCLSAWRTIKRIYIRHLIQRGYLNFNVLLIGAGKVGLALSEEIKTHPYLGLKIIGFIDDTKTEEIGGVKILGKIKDLNDIVKRYFIDEIYITIPSERRLVSEIIQKNTKLGKSVRIVTDFFDLPHRQVGLNFIGPIPLITYFEKRLHDSEQSIKRLTDIAIASVILIILTPLWIIIIILIKIESPGPAFYVAKRCGKKGEVFKFYKFRSMLAEADNYKESLRSKSEVIGPIFKIKNDPRVTRIGKLLRKYSLDELPQLINVIKGDMSLVGPRPFPVEESQKVENRYISRLNIRPGITGLAQIKGRSDLTFHHWAKWDLWYIDNWSFGLDLRILWWTIPAVLKGKGAY